MFKCLYVFWFGAIVFAQQSPTWVPYSARYSDTLNETDSSGHTISHQQKVGQEIRSSDGSKLTTVEVNGQRTTGRLWLACGQIINLDYAQKTATVAAIAQPNHVKVPPHEAPRGTIAVDGVEFVGYPVHSNVGAGTLWLNMDNDIRGKFEMNVSLTPGLHTDTVHELTSLDLASPVDSSELKIPAQFTVTKTSLSSTCSSASSKN